MWLMFIKAWCVPLNEILAVLIKLLKLCLHGTGSQGCFGLLAQDFRRQNPLQNDPKTDINCGDWPYLRQIL